LAEDIFEKEKMKLTPEKGFDLVGIDYFSDSRSMYEPEQFPGLIHRMLDPKTVILLFASGKLVCTGAKKESDVYRSVHNLHSVLEEKELMIYE